MIEFRRVGGQHNQMAVCAQCRRDALETRITRYCIAAVEHAPLLCDVCVEAA